MSFLANLFNRKSIVDKEENKLFKSIFINIQNTLRRSILDFSLLKELVLLLCFRVEHLKTEIDQKDFFILFRKNLKYLFMDACNKLEVEKKLANYYQLVTTLNFFFTLILNFQNRIFLETIFEYHCNLMKSIISCLKIAQHFKEQFEISKILLSFLSIEYLTLFNDLGLKDLFNKVKERFIKIIINMTEFSKFSHKEYKILMKHILILEFDYRKIFENEDLCQPEDKPLLKLLLSQALIRIIFSREKNEYLNEVTYEVEQNEFIGNSINGNSHPFKKPPSNHLNEIKICESIIKDEEKLISRSHNNSGNFKKKPIETDLNAVSPNITSKLEINVENLSLTNNFKRLGSDKKSKEIILETIIAPSNNNDKVFNDINSSSSSPQKNQDSFKEVNKKDNKVPTVEVENKILTNNNNTSCENSSGFVKNLTAMINDKLKIGKIPNNNENLPIQIDNSSYKSSEIVDNLQENNFSLFKYSQNNSSNKEMKSDILKNLKQAQEESDDNNPRLVRPSLLKQSGFINTKPIIFEKFDEKQKKNSIESKEKENINNTVENNTKTQIKRDLNKEESQIKKEDLNFGPTKSHDIQINENLNSTTNNTNQILQDDFNKVKSGQIFLNSDKSKITNGFNQTFYSANSKESISSFIIDDFYIDPDFLDKFELTFLRNVSKKCVMYYLEKFGDKHQVLFRREEAYDDLIKIVFVMFGHSFLKLIYNQLKILKDISNNVKGFIDFYDRTLEILMSDMPKILIILLKLIFESVYNCYHIKTFEPVLTVLFFNFIFNPKIEEFNGYSCITEPFNDVNKIVNKICFDNLFTNTDKLSIYNKQISELHVKTLLTIEGLLSRVDLEDLSLQKAIEQDIYVEGVELPNWLFYFDCDYILRIVDDIRYISNRSTSETMSSSKSILFIQKNHFIILIGESFYVKIDNFKFEKENGEDSD